MACTNSALSCCALLDACAYWSPSSWTRCFCTSICLDSTLICDVSLDCAPSFWSNAEVTAFISAASALDCDMMFLMLRLNSAAPLSPILGPISVATKSPQIQKIVQGVDLGFLF